MPLLLPRTRTRAAQLPWSLRALALGALIAAALPACAAHDEALQARVNELETRLKELERESGRQMVRFEDVNDRLSLITDRVETNRLALERRGIANPLPVVVATPQQAWGASETGVFSPPAYAPSVQPAPPRDQGYKQLEFRESRVAARIEVPDSGSRGWEQPAPTTPVDDGPYEDVTITEEEFERFVRESGGPAPAPTSSGGGAASSGGGGGSSSGAGEGGARKRSPQPSVTDERLPVASADVKPRSEEPAARARPAEDASATDTYKTALADYRAGRYAEALSAFKRYLDQGPEPDYLDNALYWVGECSYGLGQFQQAITYFDRVVKETPNGNKVPDSMLKAALAYIQMGKPKEARSIFLNLVETYPSTHAAKLATERLKELD